VAIPTLKLKAAALLLGLIALQPAPAFQQRHLRRQMAAFTHLHRS
jgi:hypothetical protein